MFCFGSDPIFGTDECGWCSEWNSAMEKLSGWKREEIIDKMLFGEVFGTSTACCRLKGQNALTQLRIVLNSSMAGQETEKFPFGFFDRHGKYVETILSANPKLDEGGRVTGVFCFLHIASPELQQALCVQHMLEQAAMKRLKALTYLRLEIKNPLYGIMFTQAMMERTALREDQKQLVETSALCQKQILKILDDMDLESIEDGYLELDTVEFTLGALLDVIISQGMIQSEEKGLEIDYDLPREITTTCLNGDQLRLQQILSNFLVNVIQFTPSEKWVRIKVSSTRRHLGGNVYVIRIEFRITHPGPGLPERLVQQMFNIDPDMSQEGFGLLICRKLVKLMNGDVQYLRGEGTSSFIVVVELASGQTDEC